MDGSAIPQCVDFSASPVQIYGSKSWILGVTRDGSNTSAYCSMRNWNTPRMLRPSVRVGAHRAINSGGIAPLRRCAQLKKGQHIRFLIGSAPPGAITNRYPRSSASAQIHHLWRTIVFRARKPCLATGSLTFQFELPADNKGVRLRGRPATEDAGAKRRRSRARARDEGAAGPGAISPG